LALLLPARQKREQGEILEQINTRRKADTGYLIQGVKLLELAEQAPKLFMAMNKDEKRQMINLVFLNPRLRGLTFEYEDQKPFSMFEKGIDLEKWRERRDLNPRPPA
jgi:hypothetical protein